MSHLDSRLVSGTALPYVETCARSNTYRATVHNKIAHRLIEEEEVVVEEEKKKTSPLLLFTRFREEGVYILLSFPNYSYSMFEEKRGGFVRKKNKK